MIRTDESIHDILVRQASAASVFDRFGIDRNTHGCETVADACAQYQLSVEQVVERLDEAEQRAHSADAPDFSDYSLTRLIQHVVRVHHRYLRIHIPALMALVRDLQENDPTHSAELTGVMRLLDELRSAMLLHFEGEEQVLFPYIAQLSQDPSLAAAPAFRCSRGVAGGMHAMAQDHALIVHLLDQLRDRMNGLAAAQGPGDLYASLVTGTRALQDDLQRHLELEDGILFPRALQLERTLGTTR